MIPEHDPEREKVFDEAMKGFIANLPDDESFRINVSKDKKRRFTSFSVKRIGKS